MLLSYLYDNYAQSQVGKRQKYSLHVDEHGGSIGGQNEHMNLRFVLCTLGAEGNVPASGRTFFGPISIDEPPTEMGLQYFSLDVFKPSVKL
jgi:hypothetical protein